MQWDFSVSLKRRFREEGIVGVEERIFEVAYGKVYEDKEIARRSVESMATGANAVVFGAKSKLFSLATINLLT